MENENGLVRIISREIVNLKNNLTLLVTNTTTIIMETRFWLSWSLWQDIQLLQEERPNQS